MITNMEYPAYEDLTPEERDQLLPLILEQLRVNIVAWKWEGKETREIGLEKR